MTMHGLSCSPVLIPILLHKSVQVIRIIPYSAVQLFSYEVYKVIIIPCSFRHQNCLHYCDCRFHIFVLLQCYCFCIQKIFRRKDGELSVFGRLAAGACAGMTSTLVIYLFAYLLPDVYAFLILLDMGLCIYLVYALVFNWLRQTKFIKLCGRALLAHSELSTCTC